jgi:hypothetical protein
MRLTALSQTLKRSTALHRGTTQAVDHVDCCAHGEHGNRQPLALASCSGLRFPRRDRQADQSLAAAMTVTKVTTSDRVTLGCKRKVEHKK